MTPRLPLVFSPVRLIIVALMIGGILAGCSSDDDEGDPTATAVPPSPTSTTAASTAAASTVAPTVISGSGQVITDGICQANVPDDWVDDTTGRGTTSSGAKYVLFGGRVRSDDAWNEAVELVKSQAESKEGSNVAEADTSIRVDFADNRGFEYRVRFDAIYCDFSVTSTSEIPEPERTLWDGIITSLVPVTT
jgi:hypothetical protein